MLFRPLTFCNVTDKSLEPHVTSGGIELGSCCLLKPHLLTSGRMKRKLTKNEGLCGETPNTCALKRARSSEWMQLRNLSLFSSAAWNPNTCAAFALY
jgi:hypothetical protein